MVTVKHHRVIDKWNVEIDGKTYWVTRSRLAKTSVDLDSDWTVESVRPSPNGYAETEWHQLVDQDGRTFKRVVALMRANLETDP